MRRERLRSPATAIFPSTDVPRPKGPREGSRLSPAQPAGAPLREDIDGLRTAERPPSRCGFWEDGDDADVALACAGQTVLDRLN